eukprot:3239002-Prymnesium_polylepis.1
MATAPLPTPERAVVYARLVTDHHAGVRKFKSVAAFHAAYLEQGGTPRKKSVGMSARTGCLLECLSAASGT